MHRNFRPKRSLLFFCSKGSTAIMVESTVTQVVKVALVNWCSKERFKDDTLIAMHQPRKQVTGLSSKYLEVSSYLAHTVAYRKSNSPWIQLNLETDKFKFGPFMVFPTTLAQGSLFKRWKRIQVTFAEGSKALSDGIELHLLLASIPLHNLGSRRTSHWCGLTVV